MKVLLSRQYYWPNMDDDIETYVKSCYVCQMDKPERVKEAGLLQPVPILERSWASVSMDFISGLSKVQDMASVHVKSIGSPSMQSSSLRRQPAPLRKQWSCF